MIKLFRFLCLNSLILISTLSAQYSLNLNKVGEISPTFYLKTIDREDFYLRNYCGKLRQPWKNKTQHIMVISFFATWCVPCMKEIPELEKIADKYKDKNVKVVLIDVQEKRN